MNELQSLLGYLPVTDWQNIPKLYTALAEWMSCGTSVLIYRGLLNRKKILPCAWKMTISLILLCIIQTLCGLVSNWLWLLGMAAAVGVMIMTIKSVIGLEWQASAYICARVFIRAEFLASIEWQIYYFYFRTNGIGTENYVLSAAFCLAFYMIGYTIFYRLEKIHDMERLDKQMLSVTGKQLALIWLITLFIFGLSNLSYIQVETPFTGSAVTEIFNIRTLIDLAGILMLEAFHMQKMDTDRRQEMTAIRNILSTHYAQYRESQDNINLINRKYHDLKHQLQIIREEENDEKRNEYLSEIENGIHSYESEIKTGNTILDTVLTSKNNQCIKQGIALTVMADGALLSHIHVMDLCTIFGNSLDNAIEYEVQVKAREKRKIHVHVMKKNHFACVAIENYYDGDGDFPEGIPLTTKADKRYHGYGLKSVRYSIEKYGGYMNIGVLDEWFRLEMLFPLNE